jgi:aminoglycoside 3-N-acetyltransferase
MNFYDYLVKLGLQEGYNVIIHSSFKKILSAFPGITSNEVFTSLKKIVGLSGSIIFPAFTYCYKKSSGEYEIFNYSNSKSKVGFLSEEFRKEKDTVRTLSPTHSFALWGKVTSFISEFNFPESPLGKGSVLEWLTKQENSYVLMLGTDFSSLSYGHYLEIESKVPWYDFSPWDYLNVLPIGVSVDGIQKLKEIPGCSKNFIKFEMYLDDKKLITKLSKDLLQSSLIKITVLYDNGIKFFKENFESLLCSENTCPACDQRRKKFISC